MKSKSSTSLFCVMTLVASLAILAGCGGTGGGNFNPPPPPPDPTITSVSASCAPTSVQTNGTSTCSATVTGTGSFSTKVTWATTVGTITAAGVLTAPASAGTAKVTATSTEDTTKSGSATVTVTATAPPPISVTISPKNPSVASGATQQFTATVTNDSSNAGVTWSASSGTISADGLFTAPTVTSQASVTVTATSVADSTKSASTTVTVTVVVADCSGGPKISSVTPVSFYFDDNSTAVVSFTLKGTCFAANQTIHINGYQDTQLPSGTSATQLTELITIASPGYSPRWIKISITSVDGTITSNTVAIPFFGNQNTLALDAAGNLYQLDQAQFAPTGQNGFVRLFKANGTANGSFLVGENTHGIAVDDTTGDILVDGAAYNSAGTVVNAGTGSPTSKAVGVSAKGGQACFTQPLVNDLNCYDLTQSFPPANVVSAGQQTWSIAMVTVGSELDAVVYARESTELLRYRVSDMSQQGGFSVTGLTPESQLSGANGGWQLVALTSAGKGALLSQFDKTLVLFDLSSMTETARISLSGLPFRIAADETHKAVIIATADTSALLTRFAKVDVTTGTLTQLSTTTPLLSIGLAVSPDGTKIDACMQGQCSVLPNQ